MTAARVRIKRISDGSVVLDSDDFAALAGDLLFIENLDSLSAYLYETPTDTVLLKQYKIFNYRKLFGYIVDYQ